MKRRSLLNGFCCLLLLVVLPSCQEPEVVEVKMPNVMGMSLDRAENALDETSTQFKITLKDLQSDRSIILHSNWKVLSQLPLPGEVVKSDGQVCLGLLKNDENIGTDYLEKCFISIESEENKSADSTSSTKASTADSALVELVAMLGIKSNPEISDSECGKFVFLVSQDGSFNFYRWSETYWKQESEAVGSLFGPDMMSVRNIDVTGDGVKDFMVRLPSWDPLVMPKPISGAVFASIECEWKWLTFRTSTKQDWYQLDNLEWDSGKNLLYGGDELTDMNSSSYTGERKTKLRYFKFDSKTHDFRLTNGVVDTVSNPGGSQKSDVVPSGALSEASFMCGTKLTDVIAQYGIVDLSPKNIAKVWFQNSDYKFRVGTTPEGISGPITAACETAAAARIGQINDAVSSSCSWPVSDLADAYGVSSKSKKTIAKAVAQDFQESYRALVIPLCIQYMK